MTTNNQGDKAMSDHSYNQKDICINCGVLREQGDLKGYDICDRILAQRAMKPQQPKAAPTQDDRIKHMVDRFLSWKLPKDFNPDGGIKFEPYPNIHPVGTNLLTATQAEEMIRYITSEAAPTNNHPTDPNYLSDCHNAAVYVVSADEGTNHYECLECKQACNFHLATPTNITDNKEHGDTL